MKLSAEANQVFASLSKEGQRYLSRSGMISAEDKDDLIQEALFRLWRHRGHVLQGMERAYFLTTLRHLLVDRSRSSQSRMECVRGDELDCLPIEEKRAHQAARELLRGMIEESRRSPRAEAFLLQVEEGWSIAEIARSKAYPPGTVSAQIARYKTEFKAKLQRRWDRVVWC